MRVSPARRGRTAVAILIALAGVGSARCGGDGVIELLPESLPAAPNVAAAPGSGDGAACPPPPGPGAAMPAPPKMPAKPKPPAPAPCEGGPCPPMMGACDVRADASLVDSSPVTP